MFIASNTKRNPIIYVKIDKNYFIFSEKKCNEYEST